MRKINPAGLAIIKRFEGCRLEAYVCPAGVLTIGWGHTGDVKPGMKITQHQADVILDYDLDRFEIAVEQACPKATDNQFSACVSLAFNVGSAAFAKSTLVKKLRAGDVQGAADQFLRWNRAGGKVLPGLTKRREVERLLFLEP